MEADRTPRSQAASQISQRAAARVSSSPKTAVYTSRSMTSRRNAAGSVTRTSPLTCSACADERSRSLTLENCTVPSAPRVRPRHRAMPPAGQYISGPAAGMARRYNATMSTRPARRPLEHVKVRATLERLKQGDPRRRCDEPPPPDLLKAIHEFNAGQFFEQHETLEILWRAEPDEIRALYQGILHVGVGFHHLLNGNYHGAVTKLGTGMAMLEHFGPSCMGVQVDRLVAEAGAVRARLIELGAERIAEFERARIP